MKKSVREAIASFMLVILGPAMGMLGGAQLVENTVLGVFLFILGGASIVGGFILGFFGEEKGIERAKKCYRWVAEKNTLYVNKQSKDFQAVVRMQKHKFLATHYVPPSYTYTGTTIGNVSVGEIRQTGDYYDSNAVKTERYELCIGSEVIHTIVLEGEALQQASRNSSIDKYVINGEIEVVEKLSVSAGTEALVRTGNMLGAINNLHAEHAQDYPTYAKCKTIFSWLCGK